jgi:peptide/nickel transport system ATP-binding protein
VSVTPLLSVRDLKTYFFTEDGTTRAVDGVSFDVFPGETLGIVGESGCGKSVTALSVMRLLPPNIGRTVGGSVSFEGTDLLALDESEMRAIRGNRIAMIFQEPMTSLNPVLTIGHQIAESVRIHHGAGQAQARVRAAEMLRLVRIPDAERRLDDYPHQFSGGMRQRVMIAMALACNPKLLIADEPTTALDVTIQAQILRLMLELKERTGSSVILITHDLGVVAETCQRVIVMYAGRKIEEAPILELFDRPAHPYTRGLMASIPRYGGARVRKRRLAEIPGIVPSLRDPIEGCAFAPRCRYAVERCRVEAPPLRSVAGGHVAACHFAEEVMATPPLPSGRQ